MGWIDETDKNLKFEFDFRGNTTILIVDDLPANLEVIDNYLKECGFTTLIAGSGEIALKRINHIQPDLILLDVMMPGIDGYETCRILKADKKTRDIPVIFMTALTESDHKVKGFSVGAVDYITKPVEKAELLARVTTHLKIQGYQKHLEKEVQKRTTELQKSQEQYASLVNNIPGIAFRCKFDQEWTMLYMSVAVDHISGYPANDFLNNSVRSYESIIHQDDIKDIRQTIKKAIKSGTPWQVEYRIRHRDGTIRWVSEKAQGVTKNKAVSFIDGIIIDITEQKEIEDHLKQAQKMEAIGILAGGVAHDFNNILSGIFGYAQLIDININNPEKIKKNLNQLIKGAQRAAGLVQQIFTFSWQSEQEEIPLKFSLLVIEVLNFLRSSIPETIKIDEKISSQSIVSVNPTHVHQIVMNLCINAYHAMQDCGGTLTVALTDIELKPQDHRLVNIHRPGNYIKLEVRDTGTGIDKEIFEKIFDPYFTTKKSNHGTGLGLSVVNGIVKKHNGFIKAYSEVGKGSTFQVFWPIV